MPPASKTSKGSTNAAGFKQLIQSDTKGAKAAFEKHVQDSAGDSDVLTRCKKLNEFLSSDFLKQGGGADSKAQLTEILGILNAGPKRPSFLDKPPVTSTAPLKKKEEPVSAAKPSPSKSHQQGPATPLSGREAGQLLDLLDGEEEPSTSSSGSQCKGGGGGTGAPRTPSSFSPMEQDDDDDLIGLLNPNASPPPPAALPRKAVEEARRKEEEEAARRKRKEQEEEAAALTAKKEAERGKAEEEEKMRKQREEKEKAERMEREAKAKKEKEEAQAKAAEEARIEKERRQRELEEEERRRQQEAAARSAAATVLQALSRRHLARKMAKELRTSAAALTFQAAFRAHASRQQLHRLQAAAELRQRWAARVISKAYLEFRRQWRLGPVRAPAATLPPKALDSHSHLLANPVRLRGNADMRTARDPSPSSERAPSPSSGGRASPAGGRVSPDESSGRRAVDSARRRVGEVGESESRRRDADGARAVMAGSSHREFQEVMAVVKKSNEGGRESSHVRSSGVGGKPPRASKLAK